MEMSPENTRMLLETKVYYQVTGPLAYKFILHLCISVAYWSEKFGWVTREIQCHPFKKVYFYYALKQVLFFDSFRYILKYYCFLIYSFTTFTTK